MHYCYNHKYRRDIALRTQPERELVSPCHCAPAMPSNTTVALLDTLCVSRHLIPAHNRLPNSSILNKPLLIYRAVFDGDASAVESHLMSIGVVVPRWRYTMYSIHYALPQHLPRGPMRNVRTGKAVLRWPRESRSCNAYGQSWRCDDRASGYGTPITTRYE